MEGWRDWTLRQGHMSRRQIEILGLGLGQVKSSVVIVPGPSVEAPSHHRGKTEHSLMMGQAWQVQLRAGDREMHPIPVISAACHGAGGIDASGHVVTSP